MKIPRKITIDDLYILNDYDEPNYVCIARKSKRNGLFYYISRKLRNVKQFYGMNPKNPTPLKDFGITMRVEGDRMIFDKVHESTAKYRDGKPRRWQGWDSNIILF